MLVLGSLILVAYSIGVLGAVFALALKRPPVYKVATIAMIVGFALHTADLALGMFHEGHLPLYGIPEVASFLSWALLLYFFIAQTRYQGSALAGLLFPTSLMLKVMALTAPAIEQTPASLAASPVLFSVHAGLVLLSYAAFVVTFMAGVMYMAQEREIKQKRFGAIFDRLPSLDTCDSMGSRALGAGFILLTLGIATGMIWSRRIDGLYWHGDPTEIVAVCTWLVYLFLVHYRLTAGWRGRRAALVSIVGFCLVVVSLMLARVSGGFHGI